MAEENKKMSYDELEKMNGYLIKQMDEMNTALKQNQFQELVVRLNFCFKVLEFSKHFDKEYVTKCAEEIQHVLVMEDPSGESNVTETPVENATKDESGNA